MTKITYVSALKTVLENDSINAEIREKLNQLVTSLEKRAASKSTSTKPTKNQRLNVGIKGEIVTALKAYDGGAQAKQVAQDLGYSIQKVSALLKQLVTDNIVAKTEGAKHVSIFSVIAE